jgi:(p)ppGpp synthase/HD superfamily hydrolase
VSEWLFSPLLERALRWAARAHRDQTRKGTDEPYLEHPVGVALILARLGYPEAVLAGALLHDVVEDTAVTLEAIRDTFGAEVANLVDWCTERKWDSEGRLRPWAERKAEQLERLGAAPMEARAVALADRLHNLTSIAVDLAAGCTVWERFRAPRTEWIRQCRQAVERLMRPGDARLEQMGRACLALLDRWEPSTG